MFRDCVRLERDVFVTWKEDDVNEQDVDEKKRVLRKKKSVESYLSQIWVRSKSDLVLRSCLESNHTAAR